MYRAAKMAQKGERKNVVSQPRTGIAASMPTMAPNTSAAIQRTMRAMM
jgi:hypothetical protein